MDILSTKLKGYIMFKGNRLNYDLSGIVREYQETLKYRLGRIDEFWFEHGDKAEKNRLNRAISQCPLNAFSVVINLDYEKVETRFIDGMLFHIPLWEAEIFLGSIQTEINIGYINYFFLKKRETPKTDRKLYIRWIGAYGYSKEGLKESLNYEFTSVSEKACEFISKSRPSGIDHVRIGLIFDKGDVVKRFDGDCWSLRNQWGLLEPTRLYDHLSLMHTEAFLRQESRPTAIVIKSYNNEGGLLSLKKETRLTLIDIAKQYNVPIYVLNRKCKLTKEM